MGAVMREALPPAPALTEEPRSDQIRAEQIWLLYANSNVSFLVTVIAAFLLSFLERGAIRPFAVYGWLLYMLVVAAGRLALSIGYRLANPFGQQARRWGIAFTAGAALAGTGWGAAGVLLYAPDLVIYQVVLAFVIGGMMLGAGSLLASRLEAFLAFLIPAGIPIAVSFLLQGGAVHLTMGLLAAV